MNTNNLCGVADSYKYVDQIRSSQSKLEVDQIFSNDKISKSVSTELSENEKLEAFKKEIWNELASLPWNDSLSVSIQITNSAFKRMMTDEDFKNRMMKIMHEEASVCRPPIVSSITIIDENGYKGVTYNDYNMGGSAFKVHSKDGFYVRKARKDSIHEAWEKAQRKRKAQDKKAEKKLLEAEYFKRYYDHQELISDLYKTSMFGGM